MKLNNSISYLHNNTNINQVRPALPADKPLLFFAQPSFPGMVRIGPYPSVLGEVTAHAGREVLMIVDLYFTDCW
jgi:hypothetical protein